MLVQVLEFLQANFRLQVRKVALEPMSTKELDILMSNMATVLNPIIGKDYSVTIQMTLDGVMI